MARADQPHKVTFEDFVARCTDFSNPVNEKHRGLDYGRPESRAAWNGSKSKIPIWCTVHEQFFVQQAANHMNGQGCPDCGKDVYKAKRRKSDPVADFRRVHGDTYDYSRMVYVNVQTQIEIVCPTHGSFWQKPNSHLTGQGCPECWENRRKAFGAAKTAGYREAFAERAARVHNGRYAIVKHPEHAQDVVVLMCTTHGEFHQKAYSHLDGHGCWQCGQRENIAQNEVASFIESLGVRIEHENRAVLDGLHIDVWAPDLKIGVEYHGSHWHTEDRVGNKHREKYERSVCANVKLIQVFDFEWLDRRSAVENRLRALFGGGSSVGARECDISEINRSEAGRFFKETHTQGAGSTPVLVYGLHHAGVLVAAMSFGMNRYGKEGWELLRYASRGRVQGGFSKLLSAFLRNREPSVLTSYCDLRWGDGEVYRRNGFTLDGITKPDFWYVDRRGQRLQRQAAWDRPEGMTQREWAEQNGYRKILGVGHQRWVWTKSVNQA